MEYRPIVSSIFDREFDRVSADSVGRDVGRVSADSVVTIRPSYWPSVGRDVSGVSSELSAECRPIVWVNTEILTECRLMVLAIVSADGVGR